MSVIFDGTEVNQIVMDRANLEAVIYNGVCVFGAAAFLASGPDIRDALTPYWDDDYGVRRYVSTINIQRTYPTGLPSTATVVRQVVVSKNSSPYAVTAYYIRASSSANVINLYIVPENEAVMIMDPDSSYMFALFDHITRITIDSNAVITSAVTNMRQMFGRSSEDTNLTGIYGVESFDTSAVENMSGMFMNRRGMTYVSVAGFDTSHVTNMNVMFGGCNSLTSLDLSTFDTSKVCSMEGMFSVSSHLETIYASEHFVTTALLTLDNGMFEGCSSLIGGNGTVYDENHIDADYARIDTAETPGYFTAAT